MVVEILDGAIGTDLEKQAKVVNRDPGKIIQFGDSIPFHWVEYYRLNKEGGAAYADRPFLADLATKFMTACQYFKVPKDQAELKGVIAQNIVISIPDPDYERNRLKRFQHINSK
jgi:hypothetical protein